MREMLWQEEWSFKTKKQRWSLLPVSGALKGMPEACVPKIPEREESDEPQDPTED